MRGRRALAGVALTLAALAQGPAGAHPEPPPIARILAGPVAAGGGGPGALWGQRSAVRTVVIAFAPRGAPTGLDAAAISASIASLVDWFRVQLGRVPGIDTTGIEFVDGLGEARSYRESGRESYLAKIAQELQARGYGQPGTRYLLYAAIPAGSVCGEAYLPPGPPFAALYLDATAACGARSFGSGTAQSAGTAETILAQEWLHNEGMVPSNALHNCPIAVAHVCTGPLALTRGLDPEERDVMFPYVTGPLGSKVLDRLQDDYFRLLLESASFSSS